MERRKLVVVGNGMAGARTVENILARGGGTQFDIAMFGDEPHGNYNRIMLSAVLNGSQGPDDILINPLSWYAANGVRLHAGERVAAIDRAARIVTSEGGVREPYDSLVIATGSRAFIPPIEGARDPDGGLKPGLLGYRTIADCHAIAAQAGRSRVAVTIGGGLLGLEVARAMLEKGLESHVVHLAGHLLDVQLDATGGGILRATMEAMGLKVHTSRATAAILGQHRVEGLAFKDGTTLACDMVIVAAGIRPNAEIGLRAGLTVERAIVVDDHMRSVDDDRVYAVGECAQHRGRVYGLVAPLWDQAKVVADQITGRDRTAAYHGSRLATKLKVMGVELASMGLTEPVEARDEVIQFSEPRRGTYKKLIVRDGRLVGGILMGELSKAAYLMQAFDRATPLPEERLALLFDLGTAPKVVAIDEMPDTLQVCNCNGVTKAAIGAAVAAGAAEPKAVMEATRAGMGCGSCKALVHDMVHWFVESLEAAAAASAPSGDLMTPDDLVRIAELAIKHKVAAVRLGGIGAEVADDAVSRLWQEFFAIRPAAQ